FPCDLRVANFHVTPSLRHRAPAGGPGAAHDQILRSTTVAAHDRGAWNLLATLHPRLRTAARSTPAPSPSHPPALLVRFRPHPPPDLLRRRRPPSPPPVSSSWEQAPCGGGGSSSFSGRPPPLQPAPLLPRLGATTAPAAAAIAGLASVARLLRQGAADSTPSPTGNSRLSPQAARNKSPSGEAHPLPHNGVPIVLINGDDECGPALPLPHRADLRKRHGRAAAATSPPSELPSQSSPRPSPPVATPSGGRNRERRQTATAGMEQEPSPIGKFPHVGWLSLLAGSTTAKEVPRLC
ncbi:unnamed protein product, partial [Urochloa humidicola]